MKKGGHHPEETKRKIGESGKGKKHNFTVETKNKLKESKLGEKNPMWKGDDVSYNELHNWVRRHKHRPELCEICKDKQPYDLANISGEYKRDVDDFQWLCRSCHMKSDSRLDELNNRARSTEFIKKNSELRKGKKLWVNRPHPWIGRHHTDATKKKISDTKKKQAEQKKDTALKNLNMHQMDL